MGQLKKKKKTQSSIALVQETYLSEHLKLGNEWMNSVLYYLTNHYTTLIQDEEGRYVMVVEIIGGIQRHYLD